MSELTNLDNKKDELKETVDRRIDEKLAANKPALVLPQPIFDFICLEKVLMAMTNIGFRMQLQDKEMLVIDHN